MKQNIYETEFSTEWDGGDIEVETACKVNLETKEVFDIVPVTVYGVNCVTGEHIYIDGEYVPVYQKDEKSDGDYWYE